MKSRTSPKLIANAVCLGLWFLCVFSFASQAQNCTSQNSPPVNKFGWIKGTTVQVYIDPSFSADQRGAIIQAFNNWTNASDSNNSGVTYQIVNSPPPAGSPSFTVSYGTIANGDRGQTATTEDGYGYTIQASTVIDSRVTNPAAILELMPHEIGHPAGFGECNSCAPADSVMGPGPEHGHYNEVVGRATSPTPCDNHNLQQTDYPYCTPPVYCNSYDPNTCTCNDSGGGGAIYETQYEQSSPKGYAGCTDYYWVYYVSYDGGSTWSFDHAEYAGCFYDD